MEGLKNKRRTLKGRFTRIQTFLDNTQTPTSEELRIRLESLEIIWEEYNLIHADILALAVDREIDEQENDYADTETRYYSLKATLYQRSGNSQSTSSSTNAAVGDIKLPRIELPKFTGNYLEWSTFNDLFTSMIHNNSKISNAQKLHYLKSSLEGEAAGLLHSLETTDSNYTEAWKILLDRYQSTRQLTQCHLSALFSPKVMSGESASELRKLLDNTVKHVRALSALGVQTEHWDEVLVYIITEKMDAESRRQWELSSPGNDYPSFKELKEFMEKRCRALEASCFKTVTKPSKSTQQLVSKGRGTSSYLATSQGTQHSGTCPMCGGHHGIFKCAEFIKQNERDRSFTTKHLNLCFNCLHADHSVKDCTSKYTCKKCGKKHNTLLHFESPRRDAVQQKTNTSHDQEVLTQFAKYGTSSQVLLSTAIVSVQDFSGKHQTCRVLLDSGSQASFITESCVQRLGLRRTNANVSVLGISESGPGRSRGKVALQVKSLTNAFTIKVEALVMSKLTGLLPAQDIAVDKWSHVRHLVLADPDFHKSAEVDILLGAEVFCDILLEGKVAGKQGIPAAYNTQFGWVLTGKISNQSTGNVTSCHTLVEPCADLLRRFWELEELHLQPPLSKEDSDCEAHYVATVQRAETGRYCVQLPQNEKKEELGFSKEIALKRVKYLERKLQDSPVQQTRYNSFMAEYVSLGHMELIPLDQLKEVKTKTNYLPHHCVVREESSTTNLRVVFDASAKTSSGVSLNDTLLVGPKVQGDVWDILMRFRLHLYAFAADIEKMFRQINVTQQDSELQRILWRPSPQQDIQHYRLNTVTYGTACAPFLAQRTLIQLAEDEGERFPLAKQSLLEDFYMDDLLTGAATKENATELQRQLIGITNSAGFVLRKWSSNEPQLLSTLPRELCAKTLQQVVLTDELVKTLGVYWNTQQDCFSYQVKLPEIQMISKRSVLSDIAKLFDPIGWLGPVVISAKIFMQKLWIAGVSWDELLDSELSGAWLQLREQLPDLRNVHIPRCVLFSSSEAVHELHGFADASEAAYGAVLYIRSVSPSSGISVRLLCAKTRVAPVKQVSLPRLELCAAVLLSQLLHKVQSTLSITFADVWTWTDSTVVLGWIRGAPRRWKTFVANRVTVIQELTSPDHWRHVASADNPADLVSRGCSPRDLCDNTLWWEGPKWMKQKSSWPTQPQIIDNEHCAAEQRVMSHAVSIAPTNWDLTSRFSTLSRLKRVTAFCLRFIYNCRQSKEKCRSGPLSTTELKEALNLHVKKVQQEVFRESIANLKQGKRSTSDLSQLAAFVDEKGVLRVGGRIRHAKISIDQRFPILLPKNQHLTELVIQDVHLRQLHSGLQATISTIQQQFWILRGRSTVRKILHKCHVCFRDRAPSENQFMGDLPPQRVQPVRPFLRSGVDYGGQIKIKGEKGRGGKIYKAYFALFVCFSTKAIHLEAVTDLTSEAMIAALRRFMARRGRPVEIWSDNGTNFIGANRELKELHHQFRSQQHSCVITDFLSKEGTTWHFIPARAPHFGGLWEAGVKSVKTHLRRVVGNTVLTFEELLTVLTQIEACLNSRPICAVSSDPSDLSVLTPGHFLIGEAMTTIPEPDLSQIQMNRLSRWQLVQRLYQHFWRRWYREYLSQLQQRGKWHQKKPNIKCGDLVLLRDDNLSPLQWPRGRIVETHEGKDGLVRVATVKTAAGLFKRPVVKLCLLPS